MVLDCHVILQDHMIEESYDFMGGTPSCNEDIVVSEFHMILQEHVIKGSCNFADSNHPAKFDGQKHSGSGGIMFLFCHVILG